MKECKFCKNYYKIDNYYFDILYFCNKCYYRIYYKKNKEIYNISHIRIYFSKEFYFSCGSNLCISYIYKDISYEIYTPEYKGVEIPIPFIEFEEIEDLEEFRNRIKLYIKMI